MVDKKMLYFFYSLLASAYPACYYSSVVDSELEGYVHILGESSKILYLFPVKDRTMSISSLPCIILESQVSTWAMLEWRFELDHGNLTRSRKTSQG
ncbi:hypothetical protein QVD17_07111 [Tagetes erecta]|uniref:Uncharacterized protein n=1 Tax=Tagetes erecta TaxID=13708 RepID=A0AAD8LN54_TARER|nr:hypothetical protein QVD17_07111 [Tagetes erecta]